MIKRKRTVNIQFENKEMETGEPLPRRDDLRRPTAPGESFSPPPPKKKKELPLAARIAIWAVITLALCTAAFFLGKKAGSKVQEVVTVITDTEEGWNAPDYVDYQPLVQNEYSRPGTALDKVTGIVVHYVANPGTTAAQNRSYFNGLAQSGATWASSHFLIGLDGEVLQLIPLDEIAYCSNSRNADTVSIECCHPEEDGKFTDKTYDSLVKLTADLCKEYDLNPLKDVIRHYDITGKLCPLYFVEHEDEWHEFLTDVAALVTSSVSD